MQELTVNGKPIRSNNKPWCARCGLLIVDANRTEWEVFVKDNKGCTVTQPICVFCQEKENAEGKKEED